MLCVISRGFWSYGSSAGGRSRSVPPARAYASYPVGLADSMPNKPHAACADRQRGSPCRGLCRNVRPPSPLVTGVARVGHHVNAGWQPPYLMQVAA